MMRARVLNPGYHVIIFGLHAGFSGKITWSVTGVYAQSPMGAANITSSSR